MELRITIPDDKAARVIDAMAAHFGYQERLPDGTPNQQTKPQFARDSVKAWIKETVRAHEEQVAVDEARADAAASALEF